MTKMKTQPTARLPWTKFLLSTLVAGSLAVLPGALNASLPTTQSGNVGVTYASGGASTVTIPSVATGTTGTLNISSTSNITVLGWTNFWDGTTNGGTATSGDTINFNLPSSTSALLNLVQPGSTTVNPTTIGGNLTSNGKISIINPNGIVVSSSGVVNTAGFYASATLENLGYFENNGMLQVFSSANPGTPTTGNITVANGATITGGGDIRLAGATVDIQGGTFVGNVYLNGLPNGTGGGNTVQVSDNAATEIIGPLSASTFSGGAINLADSTFNTTVIGNVTLNAGTGVVEETGTGTFSASIPSSTETITAASVNLPAADLSDALFTTTGNVTVTDPNTDTLALGAGTIGGSLTLTSSGNIGSKGNVAVTNAVSLSATDANSTITFAGSGPITFTTIGTDATGGSTVTLSSTGNLTTTTGDNILAKNISITSGGALTEPANLDGTGTIALSSTGNAAIAGNIGSGTQPATVTISAAALNDSGNITVAAGGKATLTSTGNTSLSGTIASPTLTITSGGALADTATISGTNATISATGNAALAAITETGNLSISATGTLTQTAALTITGNTTVNAGTATLTQANSLPSIVVLGGSGGVTIVDTAATAKIANGTSTTGNLSLTDTAGTIDIGGAASDSIQVGGNLTLSTSTNDLGTGTGTTGITTLANTVGVSGTVQLYTDAGGVLLGTVAGAANGTSSFGQVNALLGAGEALTANEGSTLNLGAITATGGLTAYSATGITTTGVVNTAGGNVTVATPGSVLLGTSSKNSTITGTINVGATEGTATVVPSSITVWNTGNTSVSSTLGVVGSGSFDVAGATSTLTVAGNGVGTTTGFGTVSYDLITAAASGAVSITNPGNLTVTNLVEASTDTNTVAITTQNTGSNLTLGSGIALGTSGATSLTAVGTIADTAASPVDVFGPVNFTAANVAVNNNTANSLGTVTFTVTGNLAYTEGSSIGLGGITMTGSSGTANITSVNGSILGANGAIVIPKTVTGLTLSAPSGAITVTNAGNVIGTAANPVPITFTAAGNSSISNGGASLEFANTVDSAGTFAATVTGATSTITQASGATMWIYGNPTFTTAGGNVTLANAGNNFGGITIVTAGGNASIRETGTDNYVSVNTGAGNFSATDDTTGIIETGNLGMTVGGTTTLSAANGAITLNATGNNFGGNILTVSAGGNASVTDSNAVTILGDGSNVGGNLTITNTNANGTIKDEGSNSGINVTGEASFDEKSSGTGFVSLTDANDTFGSLQMTTGTGSSTVLENNNTVLAAGNSVNGALTVTTYGTITNSTNGGSVFANTVTLNSTAGITLTPPILIEGQLTVNSGTAETNLGALSKASNLNGIAPKNLGTGTYVAPGS